MMDQDPYSQNTNGTYNNPHIPIRSEKKKLIKLLLLTLGVFAAVAVIVLLSHSSQPDSQQSKYIQSATAAARKKTPNAKVSEVKVADGFAVAIVSDPSADGQANAGNKTIFKVNKDGSMEQLANGSYFGPLDLLELGVPLATQAKLTGSNVEQVKQNLADSCGFNNGVPGYTGFDGSFKPDAWQIDSATLSDLEQAVTDTISSTGAETKPDKVVVCVNATQKNSNATTDTSTYISTFTLQLQFVTGDGTLSTHTLAFATGPNYYRSYMLDGQTIQ